MDDGVFVFQLAGIGFDDLGIECPVPEKLLRNFPERVAGDDGVDLLVGSGLRKTGIDRKDLPQLFSVPENQLYS